MKTIKFAALSLVIVASTSLANGQQAVRNLGQTNNQNTNFENSFDAGGQLGHLQFGEFGRFDSQDQWIGIGRPKFQGSNLPVYGMRIQDRGNTATFSLNGNPNTQNLEIQWGGNSSSRLNFNFANSGTFTTQCMSLSQIGDLTLRRKFILQNLQGGNEACELFVNGSLGVFDLDVPNTTSGNPPAMAFRVNAGATNLFTDGTRAQLAVNTSNFNTNPDVSLFVNGNGIINGSLHYLSDMRFKKDIEPLRTDGFGRAVVMSDSTQRLLELEGVTYKFNKKIGNYDLSAYGDKTHIGFIAQDLAKQFPELVSEDEDGYLAVNYTGLIPVLVEGLKDQQNMINEQTETIDKLSAKLQMLERQVNSLLNVKK